MPWLATVGVCNGARQGRLLAVVITVVMQKGGQGFVLQCGVFVSERRTTTADAKTRADKVTPDSECRLWYNRSL